MRHWNSKESEGRTVLGDPNQTYCQCRDLRPILKGSSKPIIKASLDLGKGRMNKESLLRRRIAKAKMSCRTRKLGFSTMW
jgi:hypothetical protein